MDDSLASLRKLLDAGIPEHPVADLESRLEQLTQVAITAHEEKKKEDADLVREAADYLEQLEIEIDTVGRQIRRLTELQEEFESLGPYGVEGTNTARGLIDELQRHENQLKRHLDQPAFHEANNRRERWKQQRVEELRAMLQGEISERDLEEISSDLLRLSFKDDWHVPMEFAETLEQAIRTSFGVPKLGPVQRFWNQLRKQVTNGPVLDQATAKARALREEINSCEQSTQANRTVRVLCEEIHNGIKYIARLGYEERIVQMHIWLGKMRRFQDEFDLDRESENRLYMTFGAIGHVQRGLEPSHYFDALKRTFSTEWSTYVEQWQQKLDHARLRDKMAAEERTERAARQAELAQRAEVSEREKSAQLMQVIEELGEPTDDTEIRDLLALGVDCGGCQSDDFLKLAARYPRLAYGNQFRGLRRSLKRLGVPENELGADESPIGDPYRSEFARLKPHYSGKNVVVIGGMPLEERRRQIEEGLGLKELRWYEHYRGTTQHREAETALRSGRYALALFLVRFSSHNVNDLCELCRQTETAAVKIDRGCGVTALLRGFETAAEKNRVAHSADSAS
ncbi:MAG: hypothetical protein GY716_02325 [bacterium]|nr:hypothetical protein [bacterium]